MYADCGKQDPSDGGEVLIPGHEAAVLLKVREADRDDTFKRLEEIEAAQAEGDVGAEDGQCTKRDPPAAELLGILPGVGEDERHIEEDGDEDGRHEREHRPEPVVRDVLGRHGSVINVGVVCLDPLGRIRQINGPRQPVAGQQVVSAAPGIPSKYARRVVPFDRADFGAVDPSVALI